MIVSSKQLIQGKAPKTPVENSPSLASRESSVLSDSKEVNTKENILDRILIAYTRGFF